MKSIYRGYRSILLSLSILLHFCSAGESANERSQTSGGFFKSNNLIKNSGIHVTSVGELKTLIIFAMFADDTASESNYWKYSKTELPSWNKNIINSSKYIDFPHNNLTQYFYEMSNGNFMIYGDVFPYLVIPDLPQSEYRSIGEVNYEILSRLDEEIDFSKYDNWGRGENNSFVNTPDGQVDVIFIVYRNFENRLFFNKGWTAAAYLYLTEDLISNDGVKISKGRLSDGSGIQSRGALHGFEYLKYVLAHEFGHLLFGSGHIENVTNLALMTGGPVWNASRGMHSWERESLGWISFSEIPVNKNFSFTIRDYFAFNDAYRMKLSEKEWFIFENHKGISANDKAGDNGLYIYHVKNADKFAPSIEVECADGKWEFEINEQKNRLMKIRPNRKGKTEMNFRKRINKKSYACYEEVYEDNSAWGDKHDAFDKAYNNIFSPVSIPSSINSENLEFAVYVKDSDESSIDVEIIFDEIYEQTPPSKPQIETVESNGNEVLLKWLPNEEPDIKGYNIYFSGGLSGEIHLFEKITRENGILFCDISSLLTNKKLVISVALSAFDNCGMESVLSDYVELSFNETSMKWEWKRVEQY